MITIMKAYLNASEVSKLLKVNRATVTRWLQKGMFKGAISPQTGFQWRIPLESLEKFIREEREK